MQRTVTIQNKLGLHARPAAEFVRCAQTFKSTIRILKNGEPFTATSILEVLSANLDLGAQITLDADGPDAETALKRLEELLQEFREQEEREGVGGT